VEDGENICVHIVVRVQSYFVYCSTDGNSLQLLGIDTYPKLNCTTRNTNFTKSLNPWPCQSELMQRIRKAYATMLHFV